MKVVQVCGYKNSGKTTCLQRLAQHLRQQGERVGYIKHHHAAIGAGPGDTGRLLRAGVQAADLIAEDAVVRFSQQPVDLPSALARLVRDGCTVALVEGFKTASGGKCWLRRGPDDAPPAAIEDVVLDLAGSDAAVMPVADLWSRMPVRTVERG